ncbi:hypothetical protein EPO56_02560, partial [Patescibacteria group bacterium]
AKTRHVVGFVPFGGELDIRKYFAEIGFTIQPINVPQQGTANPFSIARELTESLGIDNIVVFIPGQVFDYKGTRHGRGGGWYDKFLSSVHPSWSRVGVLHASQLQEEFLVRKSWDQPVDYLLVYDGDSWNTFTTNARI